MLRVAEYNAKQLRLSVFADTCERSLRLLYTTQLTYSLIDIFESNFLCNI